MEIFETKYWKVILADDQTYFGRLVVVSREPRTALPDLLAEEQHDFFDLVKKLEDFFKKEFSATMFNYTCLMNHAYRDGEKPHVHWHFRPRYAHPIVVANKEIADPNFGNHYIPTAFGLKDTIGDEAKDLLIKKMRHAFNKIPL